MANCLLNKSIEKSFDYNVAGIHRLYIANYDRKHTYTQDTNGYITDITLAGSGKFYEVEFVEETGYFQDDLVVSNGNRHRNITLQVVVPEHTVEALEQVTPLDLGKFVVVMVDKADKCSLLGRVNGLQAATNNYNSGTATGDSNGWTLQLTGVQPEHHLLLESEDVVDKANKVTP